MNVVRPDYTENAREIVALVRKADDEAAMRLIRTTLEVAFCEGGRKACDLVLKEVDKL